jgi:hypothetical protein
LGLHLRAVIMRGDAAFGKDFRGWRFSSWLYSAMRDSAPQCRRDAIPVQPTHPRFNRLPAKLFPRRTAPVESPPVIGRLWSDSHRSPVTEASTTLASIPTRRSGQRYETPCRDFRQRRGSGAEPDKAILAPTPNKRSFWVKPVLSLALFLHAALWVQPASRTGSPLSMKTVILKVCRQLSRVAAAS